MQAGFACADITPPVGARLNGFFARPEPSTGVDAPLMARVLALEAGDTLLLVGLDLLGLAPEDADGLVADLARQEGVSPGGIVLACSHTHSGPMTCLIRGLGGSDAAYMATVRAAVLRAARQALATRRPVAAAWGTAAVSIGCNRRQKRGAAGTVLGHNPEGPSDPAVGVLRLTGGPRPLVFFTHASHPYIIDPKGTLLSPDFWGHAAAALAARGVDGVYANGCAGNQMPRLAGKGTAASRAEGARLAEAVLDAVAHARPLPADARLRVASAELLLPHDHVPPLDAARAEVEALRATNPRLHAAWAEWLRDLDAARLPNGQLPPVRTRLTIARVGDVALLFLPSEVFYELGQRVGAALGARDFRVMAYCHNFIGYLPTAEAYPDSGYEVDQAPRFLGLWRLAPDTELTVQRAALTAWRQLGD